MNGHEIYTVPPRVRLREYGPVLPKTLATLGFQKVADFVGRVLAKCWILSVGLKKSVGGSALGAAKTLASSCCKMWPILSMGLDKKQDFVGRHQEVGWHSSRCCKIVGNTRVGSGQKAGFCRSDSRSRVAQHSVLQKRWPTLGDYTLAYFGSGPGKRPVFVGRIEGVVRLGTRCCKIVGYAVVSKKWPNLTARSRQKARICRSDSRSRVLQHSVLQKLWLARLAKKWLNLTFWVRAKSRILTVGFKKSVVGFDWCWFQGPCNGFKQGRVWSKCRILSFGLRFSCYVDLWSSSVM